MLSERKTRPNEERMNLITRPAAPERHARVLIVDDDRDWCEAACLALETEGIVADMVHDGDAAIDRCGREKYDAAIIDVQMPGRWGVDVVRELRESHGHAMPILIATAAPAAAGVCAGLLAGADEEFFKCDSNGEMVGKLRRLWRERAH
jgi:DNA-binding response OmpR family regulator